MPTEPFMTPSQPGKPLRTVAAMSSHLYPSSYDGFLRGKRLRCLPEDAWIMAIRTLALAMTLSVVGCVTPAPKATADDLVSVLQSQNGIQVRNVATNAMLMDSRGLPLYEPAPGSAINSPLTTSLKTYPEGFDLVLTFQNNTPQRQKLGKIRVGILTLGKHISYRQFGGLGERVDVDYGTYRVKALTYPLQLYSPVFSIANKQHAAGVSLQYPILDYKHDVRLAMRSPGGKWGQGEGGRGWELEFRLSNFGNEGTNTALLYEASLEPNELRSYTVSVRFTDRPDEWVRTLVPYRDYFRKTYGGVTYQRDPRPVNCIPLAGMSNVTAENTYGWIGTYGHPDKEGFKKVTDRILGPKGWDRVMVWNATGVYDKAPDKYGWPYQFGTAFYTRPDLASARDPATGYPRVSAEGRLLGFWWARSLQPNRKWNEHPRANFNPDNPEHVSIALAELQHARNLGVRMVGLDTFSHYYTPVWKAYGWLKRMRAEFPEMTFVIEPLTCDILHTLAPTFYRGYHDREAPESPEEVYGITTPFYLADFLLPGHETWGGFRYGTLEKTFGLNVTPQLVAKDAAEIAAFGLVPAIFTDFDLPPGIKAAESWLETVPADLRLTGSLAEQHSLLPPSSVNSAPALLTTPPPPAPAKAVNPGPAAPSASSAVASFSRNGAGNVTKPRTVVRPGANRPASPNNHVRFVVPKRADAAAIRDALRRWHRNTGRASTIHNN